MRIQIALAGLLLSLAVPAPALVYSVGQSTSCTHSTIAAALEAAEEHAGADTVRITRQLSYNQQAIAFTTSQDLTITGGFTACTGAEDSTMTVLDGTGGAAAPVLNITVNTGGIVRLRKLNITGGDVPDDGRGGGIRFQGNGILDIGETLVANNRAGYGGGIAALGNASSAELVLRAGTTVMQNTAAYNGGGLLLENLETVIEEDSIWIALNTAEGTGSFGNFGGYGGGINVRSCERHSILYLGSPGFIAAGVVSQNTANYGGGIAVEGICDNGLRTELQLYSTDPARLTHISDNIARYAGGGIYARPAGDPQSNNTANIWALNASIMRNEAPTGAALQLADDDGLATYALFNTYDFSRPSALPCTVGQPCGRISGNIATSGRVIGSTTSSHILEISRMEISGNRGSDLIGGGVAVIDNTLIVDNETSARLIDARRLRIKDSTIAGNSIGAAQTLAADESPTLEYLIHWQPGKTTLDYAGDPDFTLVHDIISNETASLVHQSSPRIYNSDPRFVDPANGDYSLSAASPAVDFSLNPPGGDANTDLYSRNRSVDLVLVPDRDGLRDLGAIERQSLLPLVLNGEFLSDLRNWVLNEASASAWNSENGGSLLLSRTNAVNGQAVYPYTQCVHVPGPGSYRISALARSFSFFGAPYDGVKLRWEYRRHGNYTEGCTGKPTRSGEIVFGAGNSWVRREDIIEVPASEWTRFSSILFIPVAVESGANGGSSLTTTAYIDGITLEPSDEIFSGGFE